VARFGDANIEPMLKKFGVPVTATYLGADYSSSGIVDESDEEQTQTQFGAIVGRVFSVTVKTDALPGIAEGGLLEVDGKVYTIVSVRRIDDGLVTRVLCTRD